MNLNKKKQRLRLIYMYTSWSGESKLYYQIVLDVMEKINDIELVIIDTDSQDFANIHKQLGIMSNGKGEIFWCIDDKVISSLLDYKKFKTTLEIKDFISSRNDFLLNLSKEEDIS